MADPFDYAVRFPLRVGAVLRLAQKHAPEALAELAALLDRLGYATWPVFPYVPVDAPNRPLELVKRWLALSRSERVWYATSALHIPGNYWEAHQLADTLCELVRVAVHTGEITLIQGPEAAMDELQLADLRIFYAVRVEFREDRAEATRPSTPAAPVRQRKHARPKFDQIVQAMLAHIRTGILLADGSQIPADETLAWLSDNKKRLPTLYDAGRTTCEAALKILVELLSHDPENGGNPKA